MDDEPKRTSLTIKVFNLNDGSCSSSLDIQLSDLNMK